MVRGFFICDLSTPTIEEWSYDLLSFFIDGGMTMNEKSQTAVMVNAALEKCDVLSQKCRGIANLLTRKSGTDHVAQAAILSAIQPPYQLRTGIGVIELTTGVYVRATDGEPFASLSAFHEDHEDGRAAVFQMLFTADDKILKSTIDIEGFSALPSEEADFDRFGYELKAAIISAALIGMER